MPLDSASNSNKKDFAETIDPLRNPTIPPEAGEKLPEREIFHKGFLACDELFSRSLMNGFRTVPRTSDREWSQGSVRAFVRGSGANCQRNGLSRTASPQGPSDAQIYAQMHGLTPAPSPSKLGRPSQPCHAWTSTSRPLSARQTPDRKQPLTRRRRLGQRDNPNDRRCKSRPRR